MSPHIPKFLQNFEYLKNNFKGQNSLDWKVIYTIEIFLRRRCLKWVHMTHLSIYKQRLWPKKRSGIKVPTWLPTTKSWESFWITCVQVVCHILLKSSWLGYNFALDFTLIKGLHKKLQASKMLEILISKILAFPTWES